ncbi:nicotinamide-nucleotide amidase [Maribacter vaceletii]|uniref:CinA-like protein n=1 Tax=Maribacter vaceletii TaxID=1206816 RepID=A0A495DS04_9FLAO|nr:competence/damage-inducible protein A [Maribacter vaceletii]RKR06511.1 nicotinamide-nucleotide amidase [Maribacter vaceletii]
MNAEIITIGDEILIGQIVDTNSVFIAKELNKIGVSVYQITSIQDDKEHILTALKEAKSRARIVIITGGLGPTKDDITKHTLCEFLEDTLIENKQVLEHVEGLFAKYYKDKPLSQINKNQALVPSKAVVLQNDFGTAPGMWMDDKETVFVSLPGVPFEMKNLITTKVIPKIVSQFKTPHILHRTIVTYGIGESALAERVEDWENNLPEFIKLAYLPSLGKVRLRLSAKGDDEQELIDAINKECVKLRDIINDVIYGIEDEETIEEVVASLLTNKKMSLATAESFTGGKIASLITTIPGASAYFKGSVVSYATEAKESVLKVPKALIEESSVVSEVVAKEMALAAKKMFNTDFAIATTGNAGPTKGDSNAEVGTVFIAIATPEKIVCKEFMMGAQRERVVEKSVNKAFEMLQKEILNF